MTLPGKVRLTRHIGDLDDDGHDTASSAGAHIADATDAHDASAISFTPAAGIAATDVQAAIEEGAGDVAATIGALAAHLADATDAHDASAVSIADAGALFAATNVEDALAELATVGGGGALDDLTDVTITAPASGETLRYVAGEWINVTDPYAHIHVTEAFTAVGGTPETFTLAYPPTSDVRAFVQGIRADPADVTVGGVTEDIEIDTIVGDRVVIDYEATPP